MNLFKNKMKIRTTKKKKNRVFKNLNTYSHKLKKIIKSKDYQQLYRL